ncbi:hypothetical protein F5050DRAFT_1713048 [Lentinula boryana]|uniref:Uncharacterized protein n=1 Tax=Lentinula boryana TaxID=40481 RepID=A0ABQ8Q9N0_9AGAR|nr:hypothetical protein F5050DRAFT_1713048 [Lentinula boryana]
MHLRANTFFPTLFVSLLLIASTFAIPISPDSNFHNLLSDAQSPKLGVVPQLIDARADAPNGSPPPYGSTAIATKPLEANVLFRGEQISEEDFIALRSAIETMLKPVVWFFKGEIQASIPRDFWKYLSEIKDIPNLFSIKGHPFRGTIARASLSDSGKLTGRIWTLNERTLEKDEIVVSFTDGKAKSRSRFLHALTRYGHKRS